jgi:hypothetical protein
MKTCRKIRKLFGYILTIVVACFLLFSKSSFADDVDDFMEAIHNNNMELVREMLKKDNIDLEKITDRFANILPSVEVAELLFRNGERSVNPNKFLDQVSKHKCTKWVQLDQNKYTWEHSQELVEQRNELVKLALINGADVNRFLERIITSYFEWESNIRKPRGFNKNRFRKWG